MFRLGLIGRRDFRQLFAATTVSQLGSQIGLLATPLVAVLALGASTFEVGLLTVCGTVPFLLVGLPAGAWVDRMRRRRVLIVADLGRALVFASVPLAWAFGALSLWQLYLVTLLAGVLTVFFEVSYQSYLPHLVGRDLLFEGNAKLEAVRGISQLAGPTIAGLLIQAITAPFAVAADALSFALSALFVTRIRGREQKPERAPGTRLIPEIVAGIRFVFGNELLRAIALSVSSYNFFSAIRTAMLIVLLAGELRLGAGTIGLFYSIASSGALLGALSATRIAAKIGQGAAIWVPVAVIAPLQFVIPLVQRGQSLWIAAVAYLLIWFCVSVNNITQVSLRQALTPEPLLGRMTATMRFLVWGTTPLGGLVGGVLGQLTGPRTALWIAAAFGFVPVIPLVCSPLRRGHSREWEAWAE